MISCFREIYVRRRTSNILFFALGVFLLWEAPLPFGFFAFLVTNCHEHSYVEHDAEKKYDWGDVGGRERLCCTYGISYEYDDEAEYCHPSLPRDRRPSPPIQLSLKPKTFGVVLHVCTVFI